MRFFTKQFFFLLAIISLPITAYCQLSVPQWVNGIGGISGSCIPSGVNSDKQNNIYITGLMSGTIDFDPSAGVKNLTSNSGSNDIYIAKYTTSGSLIWAVVIGGNGTDQVNGGIAVDDTGNLTIAGQYDSSSMDTDPGPGISNINSLGSTDCFLIHLDTNGGFLWSKSIGGAGTDYGHKVAIDKQGNIALIAQFQSTITLGAATYTAAGAFNGLIVKYSPSGNLLWSINLGQSGNTETRGIAVDSNDDIIVSGGFTGNVNFNPLGSATSVSGNGGATFLVKYTSAGTLIWVKTIGGGLVNTNSGLCVDAKDDIYLLGVFSSQQTFGSTTLTPIGPQDIFITKYSSSGINQWVNDIGRSGGMIYNYGIVVSQDKNIYCTGYFTGTMDFNPSPTATALVSTHGQTDLFLAKYDEDGNYKWAFSAGNASCSNTLGRSVTVDGNDDVLFAGSFCSTVNFDASTCTTYPLTAKSNIRDSFLAKYIQNQSSSNFQIIGFSVPQQISATIDQVNLKITVLVPNSTNVTALVPTISTTSGATLAPLSGAAQNFSSPVTYTLKNSCASLNYTVVIIKQPVVATTTCSGSVNIISGNAPASTPSSYSWEQLQSGSWVIAPGTTDKADYETSLLVNNGASNIVVSLRRKIVIQGNTSYDSYYDVTIQPSAAITNNSITKPATDSFCATGDAATIAGNVPNGGSGVFSYQWQSSADNISFANIPGATAKDFDPPAASNTIYYRRIATSGTCPVSVNSNLVTIQVQSAVANNTITAPSTVVFCSNGDPAIITGNVPTGGDGTYAYQWQSSADNISFTNIPGAISKDFDPPVISASIYYRRSVISGACALPVISNVVSIQVQPALSNNSVIAPATTVFCASGDPAIITGSTPAGGNGTYVYQWQSSSDNISFVNITGAASKDFDPPAITATTYYRRSATSGACTVPLASNFIQVQVLPAISGNSITAPLLTSFCASGNPANLVGTVPVGGNSVYVYQWQSSADNVTFVNIPGAVAKDFDPPVVASTIYYLRLVTSGPCTLPANSNTISIQVQPALANNAITAPSVNTFCINGNPAIITGSTPTGGNGTYAYQWQSSTDNINFVDISGATSIDFDPPVINATTYYRRTISSAACSVPINSNTIVFQVQPAISNNIITAPIITAFCTSGNPALITGSNPAGGNGAYVYQWQSSPDNINFSDIAGAISKDFDPPAISASTYYRRTTSSGACSIPVNSNTIAIVVNNVNTPSVTSSVIQVCEGSIATISVLAPQPGASYNWYTSLAKTTLLFTGTTYTSGILTASTTYFIEASNGSCLSPSMAQVLVNTVPPPAQPAIVNATVTVCSGSSASLKISNPQSGFSYKWYAGPSGGNALFTGTDFITQPLTTDAVFYAEAINSTACNSPIRSAVHVVVTPLPAAPQALNAVICPEAQAVLSLNNSDPAITIKWYTGANGGNVLFTGNTFTTPALNAPATYYAEATNANNCVSARTAIQVGLIPQLPMPVALPGDSTVSSVTFKWSSVTGATGYEVSLDNGLTYTAPSSGTTGLAHTINGLKPGEKKAILARAIGSSACQLSNPAILSLSALDPLKNQLFVPNAFTPNGDSNNDVLYVYSNSIKSLLMRIYDQWGEMLFRSNDQAAGWDGTFKGKNQPAGVYVYVIEAVSNDGTALNKKGTVTLIR